MKFINYFNNIKEFKYKKDIIKEIDQIYSYKLSDEEYKKNIDSLLDDNIIDKSSKKGKCGYISMSFLKSKNFLKGEDYYNSLKNKNYDIQNKKKYDIKDIPFQANDCIIELTLEDVL